MTVGDLRRIEYRQAALDRPSYAVENGWCDRNEMLEDGCGDCTGNQSLD